MSRCPECNGRLKHTELRKELIERKKGFTKLECVKCGAMWLTEYYIRVTLDVNELKLAKINK